MKLGNSKVEDSVKTTRKEETNPLQDLKTKLAFFGWMARHRLERASRRLRGDDVDSGTTLYSFGKSPVNLHKSQNSGSAKLSSAFDKRRRLRGRRKTKTRRKEHTGRFLKDHNRCLLFAGSAGQKNCHNFRYLFHKSSLLSLRLAEL